LVEDDLGEFIEPLLPPEPDKLRGGGPRVYDRAALEAIVFILRSRIP
jgi:transposase